MPRRYLIAVLALTAVCVSSALADWPQFLGAGRTPIVSTDVALNTSWNTQPPAVLWQTPMGNGYGGAAVLGDAVLLMDREGNNDVVRRLRMADGNEVWRYAYDARGKFDYQGSRSTPATDGRLVYTIGPMGHLKAVNFVDGELVWEKNLLRDWQGQRPNWAIAQSPLLLGDRVIVAPWGKGAAVVALDKATGREVWSTPNPTGRVMDYQSPVPMMLDGVLTVVVSGKKGYTVGVDARTGRQLWDFGDYECNNHIASPTVIEGNRVLLTGGYGAGGVMFSITRQGDRYVTRQLWHNRNMGSTIAQAVVHDGHIYGNSSDTGGGLRCLALGGSKVWDSKDSGARFEMGSVLVIDGLLFIINGKNGMLHQVALSPDGYRELGSIQALSGKEVWAPMAYTGGKLLVRDKQKLVCLDIAAR